MDGDGGRYSSTSTSTVASNGRRLPIAVAGTSPSKLSHQSLTEHCEFHSIDGIYRRSNLESLMVSLFVLKQLRPIDRHKTSAASESNAHNVNALRNYTKWKRSHSIWGRTTTRCMQIQAMQQELAVLMSFHVMCVQSSQFVRTIAT